MMMSNTLEIVFFYRLKSLYIRLNLISLMNVQMLHMYTKHFLTWGKKAVPEQKKEHLFFPHIHCCDAAAE